MNYAYRWTLDEYVLRCELDPTIREIVVEGASDVAFFTRFVDVERLNDVAVLDSDYIQVESSAVRALRFNVGAKGRLLTVATHLQSRDDTSKIQGTVVVVVDRDHDSAIPASCDRFVRMTDRHSLENYAYDPSVIDRLLAFLFAQNPVPRGRDGKTARRNRPVPGREIVTRIEGACCSVTAARLALATASIRLPERWLDNVKISPTGQVSFDADRVVAAALRGEPAATRALVGGAISQYEAKISNAPAEAVRGRDFVAILHKLLSGTWTRRTLGKRLAGVDVEQFRGILLLALDWAHLRSLPFFAALRADFP